MPHVPNRSSRILALVFLASLAAAGCERLAAKKIGTILGEIGSYEGRTVTVIGKVEERIDVPSIKCFVLNDGTGSIGVVTKGRLPLVGQKVLARGRVQAGFAIGSRKLTVVIEAPKPTATVPRNRGPHSSGPG